MTFVAENLVAASNCGPKSVGSVWWCGKLEEKNTALWVGEFIKIFKITLNLEDPLIGQQHNETTLKSFCECLKCKVILSGSKNAYLH